LWDRTSEYLSVRKYRLPWPEYIVLLARTVNKCKRRYRRSRFLCHLSAYLHLKKEYHEERANYLQERREKHMSRLTQGQNIWSIVRNTFRPFSTSFRGIKTTNGIEKDPQSIVNLLGNFFENHFSLPQHNPDNIIHTCSIIAYEQIKYLPNMPLELITLNQVEKQWLKFSPKNLLIV